MPAPLLARAGIHTSLVYAMLFMANGAHMPFWPLWLGDWGLSPAEIGIYSALGMAVRIVAGLAVPALADRLDNRRQMLAASAAATVLLFLAHLAIGNRAVLLVATLAVGATMAGTGPLAEALGVAASRHFGFVYAKARGLGSAGFLVANLVVGVLIARYGSGAALWWVVVCMAVLVPLALGHPGGSRVAGRTPPSLREIGRLMINPVFAVFMAALGLLQGSHAVMYAYGSVHWRDLGLGEGEIGALWAVSVSAEILLMLTVGTAVVQRVGAIGALMLAGAGGMLRWGAMMADPTGLLLWPVQCLHACTFAFAHLGAITFISRAVPDRYAAAAQGGSGAMAVGAGMALGMVLAAVAYPALGGRSYGIALAFSAGGIALSLLLARRWQGEELAV